MESSETAEPKTKGVEMLLGDPKKAIIKLAIPSTISSLLLGVYQIINIIWVSGLGSDALALIGFIGPFFMIALALQSCLGVGGGMQISRKIGEGDKQTADKLAANMITMSLLLAVFLFILFMIFGRPILMLMGAERLIDTATSLVFLFCLGLFALFFFFTSTSILNNEGDAKRAMLVGMIGLVLCMLLDPVFIYYFNLGVRGVFIVQAISFSIASLFLVYWFFIKRNTYVTFRLKNFVLKKSIVLSIIKLGIPVTMAQLLAPLSIFFVIMIITRVSGTDGVAVISTGSRFTDFAEILILGIPGGMAAVVSAAWGAKDYKKMEIAFNFALKTGLLLSAVFLIPIFLFAPQITLIFTWSENTAQITNELVTFIRIFSFNFICVLVWVTSITFLVSIGRSIFDFACNLVKHLLITPLCYVFAILLGYGLNSVWVLMTAGFYLQAIAGIIIARVMLKKYTKVPTGGI